MADLRITVGPFVFAADFARAAPRTVGRFESLLPFRSRLVHARWSGEACWIPMGDLDLGLGYENATSYPRPGELLLHPGGISETEILFPYGAVRFASRVGQLAGNHFLTILGSPEPMAELGRIALWEGAQDIEFTRD
jgi:Protein of unknown function (DUF3830)